MRERELFRRIEQRQKKEYFVMGIEPPLAEHFNKKARETYGDKQITINILKQSSL